MEALNDSQLNILKTAARAYSNNPEKRKEYRMVVIHFLSYITDKEERCLVGRHDNPGQPRFFCGDCMKD